MVKVLVIESDAIFRYDIAQLLESSGHHPIEADSGEQGLQLATSEQPDIILCATKLSDTDAFEVLQGLRSQSHQAQPHFILLSGSYCSPTCRRALQLGVNDCLSKPLNYKELLEAVSLSFNT